MHVWIQCRTSADAEFFEQAVLEGYFGYPLSCGISPLNPCSVDVNFDSMPVEDEKIQKIPFLVEWDYYGNISSLDQAAATTPLSLPDLRRGVLLRMNRRKRAH
jgi:hypothetical protein